MGVARGALGRKWEGFESLEPLGLVTIQVRVSTNLDHTFSVGELNTPKGMKSLGVCMWEEKNFFHMCNL